MIILGRENKREIVRRLAKRRKAKGSILLTVGCSSRWIKETGLRREILADDRFSLTNRSDSRPSYPLITLKDRGTDRCNDDTVNV